MTADLIPPDAVTRRLLAGVLAKMLHRELDDAPDAVSKAGPAACGVEFILHLGQNGHKSKIGNDRESTNMGNRRRST
jgi:hypothetical protein